jgi:hypothetical protein
MASVLNRPARALRLARALALALAAATAGCGYSIRPPYEMNVRTVYVPVFRSLSFRRDIQLQITELVIKEIEKRTPYKVVGTPDEADTILEGTINYAEKQTVVENPYNLPRQTTVNVSATVKWTHNPPSESEQAMAPVMINDYSYVSPEIGESISTGMYQTMRDLATQVVDMMEQPW